MGAEMDTAGATGSAGDRARAGAAITWLAVRWVRRRWIDVVPLALVVLMGTGGTLGALASAERTSAAYPDYLERSNVGHVRINPAMSTAEIDAAIRSLPGVEQVTTDVMLVVSVGDGRARPRWEGARADDEQAPFLAIASSSDGRFVEMDVPIVREGRVPTGPSEMAMTGTAAADLGLAIGDVVSFEFWTESIPSAFTEAGMQEFMNEVVEPIGVEEVELVGLLTLHDEVLPDELFALQRLIFSPDIVRRYECLPSAPPPGSTVAEAVSALLPEGCAVSYRYYSVRFRDGVAGVKPALDEFLRRAETLNLALADLSDIDSAEITTPQHYLIATERDDERRRVESALRPTITGLLGLASAAGFVTLALASLLIGRELRRTETDHQRWRELGIGSRQRAVVGATPMAIAVLVGTAGALALVWASGVGPVGFVRVVDPEPARHLPIVALFAAVAISAALLAVVAVLARAASRSDDTPVARAGRGRSTQLDHPTRVAGGIRLGPPALTNGVRHAWFGRTSAVVIGAGALLAAAFVAVGVFGSSLRALDSTPARYGWPWDVAVMTGYGYGELDIAMLEEVLPSDPDVASWSVLGFLNEMTVDGEPTMTLVDHGARVNRDLTVLSGRLPAGHGEVAIGSTTASTRGIQVGDTVLLGGVFDTPRDATVTGIVVFPALGAFGAGRVGAGTGLLIPEEVLTDLGDSFYAKGPPSDMATFVGIDLHHAVDTPENRRRVMESLDGLDLLDAGFWGLVRPVRPPEMLDLTSAISLPATAAAVLAGATILGLIVVGVTTVRTRAGEVAVLRALGFTRMDVSASIYAWAVATMAASLAIGVPIGVIVGRWLWRTFAEELGVVPDPSSPWTLVVAATGGGLCLAVAAAFPSTRMAVREQPAAGLRTD